MFHSFTHLPIHSLLPPLVECGGHLETWSRPSTKPLNTLNMPKKIPSRT